jgi:hypothetical protein
MSRQPYRLNGPFAAPHAEMDSEETNDAVFCINPNVDGPPRFGTGLRNVVATDIDDVEPAENRVAVVAPGTAEGWTGDCGRPEARGQQFERMGIARCT